MKSAKELGEDLCEYCYLDEDKRGVRMGPKGPIYLCNSSGCENAYDNYKEGKQMFTRNMVSDFLRALANEIDYNSVSLKNVYIDNNVNLNPSSRQEKQLVINYDELTLPKGELDNEF